MSTRSHRIARLLLLLTVGSLLAFGLVGPPSALAITNGVPDGNAHPNVGALVIEINGQKDWICSGTLISPTVFLTCAHCTADLADLGFTDVWVTFDAQFNATSGTFIHGTAFTNPAYDQRASNPGDMAVVVLDTPQIGLTPARLPALGQFTKMAARNGLKGQTFTAVGYGGDLAPHTTGKPMIYYSGTRERAVSSFRAITASWLRLSQNAATGDGGTCYGDSGGPDFLGDSNVIAAITVTGDTACKATNVDYRLDTPSARAFLGQFVTLP